MRIGCRESNFIMPYLCFGLNPDNSHFPLTFEKANLHARNSILQNFHWRFLGAAIMFPFQARTSTSYIGWFDVSAFIHSPSNSSLAEGQTRFEGGPCILLKTVFNLSLTHELIGRWRVWKRDKRTERLL